MHIYLSHPVHGSKVAISELEAELDEANGWVRYELGDAPVHHAPPANELEFKRRGRPRKAERIEA